MLQYGQPRAFFPPGWIITTLNLYIFLLNIEKKSMEILIMYTVTKLEMVADWGLLGDVQADPRLTFFTWAWVFCSCQDAGLDWPISQYGLSSSLWILLFFFPILYYQSFYGPISSSLLMISLLQLKHIHSVKIYILFSIGNFFYTDHHCCFFYIF